MKKSLLKITERDGISFNAASAKSLTFLKSYNLPRAIIEFYSKYEPRMPKDLDAYMDINIRLLSIKQIKGENELLEPSCYLTDFGYIAFATNQFGNPFLFDLNKLTNDTPRIVSADHELSYLEEIEESDAHSNVQEVASSLEEFLSKVANEEL